MKKWLLVLALCALPGKSRAWFGYTSPAEFDPTVTFCVSVSSGVEAVPGTGINGNAKMVPFTFTANSWYLTGNASGSAVVDVVKDSLANFPPTTADTIVSASTPSASSVQWSSGTTSGWATTTFTQGEYVDLNIVSISTFKRLQFCVQGKKQ